MSQANEAKLYEKGMTDETYSEALKDVAEYLQSKNKGVIGFLTIVENIDKAKSQEN